MGMINYIIKIFTFPGTLLKAFLEQLACRMYGIPVEFSKYFQKNELCGHIEHVLAPQKGSFGLCFLPHIIMLFCGFIFTIPASMNLIYLGKVNVFGVIFMYIGLSCFLNCFPLIEDAVNMWDKLYGKNSAANTASKIFLAIPAAVMFAGAYLEHYFVTLLTTAGFVYAMPFVLALLVK